MREQTSRAGAASWFVGLMILWILLAGVASVGETLWDGLKILARAVLQ